MKSIYLIKVCYVMIVGSFRATHLRSFIKKYLQNLFWSTFNSTTRVLARVSH